MNSLRKLVWLYLLLLIFEGALRKWGIPALNAPLLLIRDPVVLAIYFQAYRHRLSFSGGLNAANLFLAVSTVLTATIFGYANFLVTIYGFLANYFQIPLIFLIPQILDRDDVLRMGKFFLWMAIPMALLTVLQFRSDPEGFWNKGAMATHYHTVRPSGTFSFSNGLAYFFAISSVFLFYGYLHARTYKLWLLVVVTGFTLVAAGCSGSRTCVVSIGLVIAVAILCVVIKGRGAGGILVAAALVGLVMVVVSSISVFNTGTEQLEQRFTDAGAVEGGAQGFVGRFLGTLFSGFEVIPIVPFFGFGLGSGTNGAAALFDFSTINVDFPWVENEWERLVAECGPVLGILLCVFRIALTYHVGRMAFRAFRHDNILPALLFSACGVNILNGQWGGPTPLGFAVFGAGLTLAACHEPDEFWDESFDELDDREDQLEDESSPAHDPV
jgi:hypothetical protein